MNSSQTMASRKKASAHQQLQHASSRDIQPGTDSSQWLASGHPNHQLTSRSATLMESLADVAEVPSAA
jgi:hypothetical protein